MRNEAAEKAAKIATEQTQIANARAMLADGVLSLEQIAKYSSLPIEKVRELAGEVGA